MTTPAPFGFATDPAPAPVPVPTAPPVPVAQPVAGPGVGSLVSFTEVDVYDEAQPYRTRYGVVVGYDANGAAQVLVLGNGHQLAHFAPVPTEEGPHGPLVTDLTAVR